MSEVDKYIDEPIKQYQLLSNLAVAATLFSNDLKHMHVHVTGEKFNEMHEILKSFYEEADKEQDFFSEYGIINNEGVSNPSIALSKVNVNWEPENKEMYEYDDYLEALWIKGNLYINMLEDISDNYNDAVYSTVDDFIKFWYTEIKYKLAAQNVSVLQSPDPESFSIEDDFDDEEISLVSMYQESYKKDR